MRAFVPGDTATLLTLVRSTTSRVFNRQVVESNAPGGPSVRVVMDVSDPASPIHQDRIGLHPAPVFRSAQLPDVAAGIVVARARLTEHVLRADAVAGTAIPDRLLNAGDVVTFEEPVTGTSGRYRLNTVTQPVVLGSMPFTAGRVVPLVLTEAV
jgi:hypothetical protein